MGESKDGSTGLGEWWGFLRRILPQAKEGGLTARRMEVCAQRGGKASGRHSSESLLG